MGLDKVTSFDSATSDLVVASEDSGLHFLLLSAPCLTTVTAGSEGSLFDGGVDLARRAFVEEPAGIGLAIDLCMVFDVFFLDKSSPCELFLLLG